MKTGKQKQVIGDCFFKHWRIAAVLFLAVVFFIGTSSFSYLTQNKDFIKWLSPDETANYIFTKLYSQENDLRIYERYNLYARDIMHPRSFRSDYGQIKPVSFLGMMLLYGKIASWTTYLVIPYLTPFFSSLGLIFFYLLLKRIFGPRNALISVFLMAFFPVFVYYSARSMFHNTLFAVLLIIGLYFSSLSARNYKPKKIYLGWLWAAAAGLMIGLAATVRTSELLWLAPALFTAWLFYIREIGLTKLVIFLSFMASAMLPTLYWNQILYGSPYFGGYPEMNSSLIALKQSGAGLAKSTITGNISQIRQILNGLKQYIFYFGFNPAQSARMFYHYFILMFGWLFLSALGGATVYYARYKKIKKKQIAYLSFYIIMSFILIFYYGSWQIHDNPDPASFTIGNSYTRYWLPVYLGALPFAAWFLMSITRFVAPKWLFQRKEKAKSSVPFRPNRNFYLKILRTAAVAAIGYWSVNFVLYGSAEGLWYAVSRQKEAEAERDAVLRLTGDNSVVITEYHDKLLFPERKVIVGRFNDDNMNAIYAKLAARLPVYYYNFTFPDKDVNYLNSNKLIKAGLRIMPIKKVTNDFTLYNVSLIEIVSATDTPPSLVNNKE